MIDTTAPAVVFDQVSKSFGTKQVLRDVSFELPAGEALCILGRSGTGKSVTLKLIISLLKPDKGKIWVEDDEITRLNESGFPACVERWAFFSRTRPCLTR